MEGLQRGDLMLDEKILLENAQSGNADCFGLLYGKYQKELYLYAYKFLGNREDAEDAVQQATVKVYTSLKNIRKPEAFKGYYFKALSNTARSMLARNSIHIVSDGEELVNIAGTDDTESSAVNSSAVSEALKILSDSEREIVLLSVVGGFTSREISKITDLTGGSVRSKLSRALSKMRAELE